MFEDTLRQIKTIIEAYEKVKQSVIESSDTGGDGSAYNKYLLGKTGDLPKSKYAYMAEGSVDSDPWWDVTFEKDRKRKTYRVRAASHDNAVKHIKNIYGGFYIGSGQNISGEQSTDGGGVDGGGQ